MNFIVSVPECYFHPCDRRPSLLYIKFLHNGASIFTSYLYPKNFPVVSQWMGFDIGYTVISYFGGYLCT